MREAGIADSGSMFVGADKNRFRLPAIGFRGRRQGDDVEWNAGCFGCLAPLGRFASGGALAGLLPPDSVGENDRGLAFAADALGYASEEPFQCH